jgi:uncharacterized protein DUF4258
LDIRAIIRKVEAEEFRFTLHAVERCIERNISPNAVKRAIIVGEIIEEYPDDKYGPSCLIHGEIEEGEILHIQCSTEPVWIVTVYDPTRMPEEWDDSYKRRRIRK